MNILLQRVLITLRFSAPVIRVDEDLGGLYGGGGVFKLTPAGGNWIYTSLQDFTGGVDGWYPYGNVVFDSQGNIYGTTEGGGQYNYGVVFQIVP